MSAPPYVEAALAELEQHGRRMALLCRDALAGVPTEFDLRGLLAGTARDLANALEDRFRELYPPESVPPDGPGIGPESETGAVVAWCAAQGLEHSAQVRGRWVWIAGRAGIPYRLELIAEAAGFRWSEKRGSWYHTCGVVSTGSAAGKPLSRYHGTSSLVTYQAGNHSPEPAWKRQKAVKAVGKARKAALRRGEVPKAYGAAMAARGGV